MLGVGTSCHTGGACWGALLGWGRDAPDEHHVPAPNLRLIVPMHHCSSSIEMCG